LTVGRSRAEVATVEKLMRLQELAECRTKTVSGRSRLSRGRAGARPGWPRSGRRSLEWAPCQAARRLSLEV